LFGWATPQGWRQGLRPGQETSSNLSNAVPSKNANTQAADQRRDVSTEDRNVLVRQIQAMAEPLGRRLYRGVLKTVAKAWDPREIREAGVLRSVLEQMQSAERGLRRLEAALNRAGPESLVPILRSLRLNSLAQVDNLDGLKKIVLAAEQAAGITH
jgi:hypothetical protein